MKRRVKNLGIFAHVDAGKTTVTEQMMFISGAIKNAGSVDKGTSHSDSLSVEKERGISVRTSSVSFDWKGTQINLLDTPGHIDFSAEVERSLRVIDCAVLVLSAVEGIQAQTETIWSALKERKIPTIIFVNKADRIGAQTEKIFDDLSKEFSENFISLNIVNNEAESNADVEEIQLSQDVQLVEMISEKDENLLVKYLEEKEITSDELDSSLARSVKRCELYPVVKGIAKNGIGIEYLMNCIVDYLPDSSNDVEGKLSGVIYKIDYHKKLGRMAGIRLFSGRITNRDNVRNDTIEKEEKVTQIKKYYSDRFEDINTLEAGDIGFISGLSESRIGDILGDPFAVPDYYKLSEPLLCVKVEPKQEKDYSKLAEALQVLSSEDPHLNFVWFKEDRELQVNIMGKIQIEILTSILKNRFELEAEFSPPTVIYKETPSKKGYGFESYTMPKPCWAVVKFEIEPGERGSGVMYSSVVSVNNIERKYQNEIEMILPEALKQGIKGWDVTDMRIKLIEGEHHVMHSRPGDFKLATLMGIMKGLNDTGTDLLEPMIDFKISAAEEYLGKITSDIINMRGSFEPAEIVNSNFILRGRYPLATSMKYSIRLSSLTGGKGKLTNRFGGYEICPTELGEIREYKGVHPLDRSKFILKWRGAITE